MLNGLFIWLGLGPRAPLSHSRDILLGAILGFRVLLMDTLGCSKQGRGIKLWTSFWATASPTPTNVVACAPALRGQHTFSYPNLIWLLPLWRHSLCLSGTYKWHLTQICDLTLLDFELSKDTWDLNIWGKTPTDSCPRLLGMVANGRAMPRCSKCFFHKVIDLVTV